MNVIPHWRRHDLAWLQPGIDLPAALPEDARRWLEAGNPAVVCRRDSGPELVRLGVALPAVGSDENPRRCAVEIEPGALAEVRPPLDLEEAIASAPAKWRQPLKDLCCEGEASGLRWHVLGSLAWRHLHGGTGFVDETTSDVDLLFAPKNSAELDAALHVLARASGSLLLDGEIRFPGHRDVSWREWARRPSEVLTKELHGMSLRSAATLQETLTRAAMISCT